MFYGQHYIDEIIYTRFFKEKTEPGFFVECGAFDGVRDSCCKFFEDTLKWKGLNIEPVPYIFEKLQANRPNCINEMVALASENKIARFKQAIRSDVGKFFGNGSLRHAQVHLDELNREGCTFEEFDVQCVPIKELVDKYSIEEIDLFVLDVEGFEIDVLSNLIHLDNSILPKVFCIETGIINKDKILELIKDKYNYHSDYSNNSFFIKK